jgi:catechol 2,3-dioxygenase-like lactoylglutathione lyase family enzyme
MLKKIVCCALIVLTLGWLAVKGVFETNARTGHSSIPADAHQAQPATSTTKSSVMSTGAFFALSVADIDASAKWYSEKLGLKIVMRPPKANRAAAVVLEGGGLIVELIQHDDAVPLSKVAPAVKNNLLVHGIFKAGVIVDDFDRTVAMFRERNVPIAFGPFPARANQRANVIIRDNGGNLIQFFGK